MTEAAETLLKSYPDYSKAPETYLLSIAEVLSQLPEDVVVAALNLTTGVRARCAFLPTVADVVKFAEEYTARRNQFKTTPAWDVFHSTSNKPLVPPVYHERVSQPHLAPGKPWGVKPIGYWTEWTPEQRQAHDDEEKTANGG